ncbi:hypothetical protein AB6860_03020 [Carnobacterium divergens]|uniref:fibronectin type III domain-containing protein n=1 Tax=Carnobacterium divergens TaxID=2748 RepID=UPI0039C8E51E
MLKLHPNEPQKPAIPTNLKGTTTVTQTNLTWDDAAGATNYSIYRDGEKVGDSDIASYKDTNLTADTEYSYQVTATNESGESDKSTELKLKTSAGSSK